MAAQTLTGPAQAPRPTSSTPATILAPVVARIDRSTVWVGGSYGMAPARVRRRGRRATPGFRHDFDSPAPGGAPGGRDRAVSRPGCAAGGPSHGPPSRRDP